ncbi:serine hydrolase [Vulcanococcus limneticus Candia 3F8]|uniref:serine hydrolase n=1 Tax=Vulcanococcus limneticus TaxID=2170428 RepID=UPI000B97EE64|nr:serine hydrolase [Vulcanococcus limneticus]MCP9791879.1 serine hydrolase [Vulcanococcus limneticus MW73D5]MCP9894357.1 serine hydrolase [Vulcanococcus limneticus Candia 3F8]MCP9897335.1 serine hydrolase [Vulcanococcus limneticus Candia 3B3]
MAPRTLTRPHTAGLLALAPLLMAASLPPAGLPGYAPGTGVDAAAARRISRWALAEYAVPGAAIALVQDGRLTLVEGFGVRDLASGAPTTADTVFQLASVSKTFTAATVAALVDRKKLGWEQPMVSLLPGFRLQDAYAGQWVNARDLLSHRAGFPAFFGDLFDHLGYGDADVLRRIRYVEPATSFRDRPAYSNIGFFLAGELAAQAGGQPFPELTRSLIVEPLAMTRTGVASRLIGDGSNPDALTDISRSHAVVNGRLQVVPPNLSALFIAAGGFASNATDLGRFITLLARGGEIDGRRVLSEAAVKAMFEPVIAEEPGFAEFPPIDAHSGFDYSPGWGVYHYNGLKVLEKGGALDGVRTLLVVVPQKRFAVAILANRNLTALPEAVRAALLQQAFGRPGEADLQPAIRAKAQDIERLLLAAEPRPADAKPPARPLAAYTGTYRNDLWGTWTVAERDGALEVQAGPARYRAPLTPWNGETFALRWPGVLSSPVQVPFRRDAAGRMSGFDYLGYGFRRVVP